MKPAALIRAWWLATVAVACGAGPAGTPPPVVTTPRQHAAPTSAPVRASPSSQRRAEIQIAIAGSTVCLRLRTSLWCWSRKTGIKLPLAQGGPPLTGLGEVSDVSLGYDHVCAVGGSGRVWCWGDNSYGQLGAGLRDEKVERPTPVRDLEGVVAVRAGSFHTCALLASGQVSCWGRNESGETGSDVNYTEEARELAVPETVEGVSEASELATGRDQSCALTRAGWSCWGRSYLKKQAEARGWAHNQPAPVEELSDLAKLALHDESACGVFAGGSVSCWGSGAFSLLVSQPMRGDSLLTVEIPPARELAVGGYHACAILQDGSVSCWGLNAHGELGRPVAKDNYEAQPPARVDSLPRADSLALGPGTSCAIVRSNELWCWGAAPHLPWVDGSGSGTAERVPIH